MKKWIYSNSKNNLERYILGETSKKTLVCIGINPSTAEPDKLDNTVNRVKSRALSLNYDSWIMINLYPQRATDPNDLHREINTDIHKKNLDEIKKLFNEKPYDIWAAWGTLIEKRPYMVSCLKSVYEMIGQESKWFTIGKRSKNGHPHHPLYLKNKLPADLFDIERYIVDL